MSKSLLNRLNEANFCFLGEARTPKEAELVWYNKDFGQIISSARGHVIVKFEDTEETIPMADLVWDMDKEAWVITH